MSGLQVAVRLTWITVLYFVLPFLSFLLGDAIDSPFLDLETTWLRESSAYAIPISWVCVIIMALLVPLDCWIQRRRNGFQTSDLAFYPRVRNLPKILREPWSRLVFIVTILSLGGYYTRVEITLWYARQMGLAMGPERVFFICMLLWGGLWFADCLTRPRQGTIVAAIGFVVLCLLFFVWSNPLLVGIA